MFYENKARSVRERRVMNEAMLFIIVSEFMFGGFIGGLWNVTK